VLPPGELAALTALVCLAALLYSSVGHAGASGYLAAMALFGVTPEVMKPAALLMNIVVAGVASWRFRAAGHYRAALFWPFAAGSVPLAFVGGRLHVPAGAYQAALGGVLLFAAVRMALPAPAEDHRIRPPPLPLALLSGAGIGFVSGAIGVGGGIFLSPLVLFAGWAGVKETAAVSAPFILVNSIAGLAGLAHAVGELPSAVPALALAALLGALCGSWLGARRLPPRVLRWLLAVVLLVAGMKLLTIGLSFA
jgi:hypothetical protein